MRAPLEVNTPEMAALPSLQAAPASPAYVFGPQIDFWVLGGASIFLWALLLAGDYFRETLPSVKERFTQISIMFSFLSLFVNYPHFMVSYHFGYGRGAKFVVRNWFALLFVPVAMIAGYALAYQYYAYDVSTNRLLLGLDKYLAYAGLDLGIKYRGALGREILTASIWIMYFTVGWHYAKQVFGSLMVYGRLKGYIFQAFERQTIKCNLFCVAIYQFLVMNKALLEMGVTADPRFPGVTLTGFACPEWIYAAATALLAVSTVGVLGVFANLFFRKGYKPDLTFLMCWVSFLVWWIPVRNVPEFYLWAVPFFHSLQYLLFAAKLETSDLKGRSRQAPKMLAVFVILAGIAGFELVPVALDMKFETSVHQSAWFFMAAAAVFFNVHHFFIDSVVWKLSQKEVKKAFFGA